MKTITRIDLTPTREEHARITAYIMASHLKGSPYSFGDYWNYTPEQENAIFATWNALEDINKVYQLAGMDFWQDCPIGHKAKLIKATYESCLEGIVRNAK
jgi:hypothetical protein